MRLPSKSIIYLYLLYQYHLDMPHVLSFYMTDLSHLDMFLAREGVTRCKSTSELIKPMWGKSGEHGIAYTMSKKKNHIKMNTSFGPVFECYTSTMYTSHLSMTPVHLREHTHTHTRSWSSELHSGCTNHDPLLHPMPPIYTAASTFPVVSSYSLLLWYNWQTGGQLNPHCSPHRSRV